MNSNKRKDATLGMPHGTANGRLRKNILFHLLRKLNENVCFKCGQKIEKVEDLSIEHKLPWEGRSAELFWDLDNIAFSHLHCNRPHERGNGGRALRKIGPEGTAWCSGCQDFLPIEKFYNKQTRWNGFTSNCKYHHDKQQNHGIVRGRVSSVAGVSGNTLAF